MRLDVLLLASLHKQARSRNAPLSDMHEGGHGANSFIHMTCDRELIELFVREAVKRL